MMLPLIAVVAGLLVLFWSGNRFIVGSAATAKHLGLPPLLIGMVIVGFGTSAPELVVGIFAAAQGNPGIALGNAYGSNIANIALILGATALLKPIGVRSRVLRAELPVLAAVTLLAAFQVSDGLISRLDSTVLVAVLIILLTWAIWLGLRGRGDALASEVEKDLESRPMPLPRAVFWMIVGLVVLVASSRVLVWGAVELAQGLGVSDLIIGLTVIAIGTSLPELVSSIIATRKGEHDLALGNVLGSNLFNTLAVVGIAGLFSPMEVGREVLTRDFPVMGILTASLFVIGYGFRGREGRINRYEGAALLIVYAAYTTWLVLSGFIVAH
jgi:cation:H+ antiporter